MEHSGETDEALALEHTLAVIGSLWFGSWMDVDPPKTRKGNEVEVLSPGWWDAKSDRPRFMRTDIEFGGDEAMWNAMRGSLPAVCYARVSDVPGEKLWRDQGEDLDPWPELIIVMWDDDEELTADAPIIVLENQINEDFVAFTERALDIDTREEEKSIEKLLLELEESKSKAEGEIT